MRSGPVPPATTGAESSVGNCTKESLLRDSSCAVAKTLSTCWFQQDRALTEYPSDPSTRSCQSTQPSSFCNFGFPALLLSLLSCGGARLPAPLSSSTLGLSSGQRMLYFEFGQNRMAEGGAFAEHVRAGAECDRSSVRGSLRSGANDQN